MTNPGVRPTVEEERAAKVEISELIIAERLARDDGQWDRMASFWHPESSVELTWFEGTGANFAAASSKVVNPDSPNFHMMAPSLVTLHGNRAVVETPCSVLGFAESAGWTAAWRASYV